MRGRIVRGTLVGSGAVGLVVIGLRGGLLGGDLSEKKGGEGWRITKRVANLIKSTIEVGFGRGLLFQMVVLGGGGGGRAIGGSLVTPASILNHPSD